MWCEIGGMVIATEDLSSLVNQNTSNIISMDMGFVLPKSHMYHEKTCSLVFPGIFKTIICKVYLPKINTL